MKKNPVITGVTVSTRESIGRAERDFIRRHQAALKEIERWEVALELRPPTLAREVLRADEVVMPSIDGQDGPLPLTDPRLVNLPAAHTLDQAVDKIRLQPSRTLDAPDDPDATMTRIVLALTILMVFSAGVSLGIAL